MLRAHCDNCGKDCDDFRTDRLWPNSLPEKSPLRSYMAAVVVTGPTTAHSRANGAKPADLCKNCFAVILLSIAENFKP